MSVRLRQIALVARDLEPTLATLQRAFGVELVERDPGVGAFGLHNGLLQFGDCFLEVVAPLPATKSRDTAAGRYMEKFDEGGYMVLVQVPSLAACERRMVGRGLRTVHCGGRTPDNADRAHAVGAAVPADGITGTHFHPRDMGCIIEVTEQNPAADWLWAGPRWRGKSASGTSARSAAFAGVELAVAEPEEVCARWADGMGLAREPGSRTSLLTSDGARIRFRRRAHPGEDGPVAVQVWAREPSVVGTTTVVCGVAFTFVAAAAAPRL